MIDNNNMQTRGFHNLKDEDGKIKRVKPFSEVAQQAAQDFMQEKKQEAYRRIIERLMKAEQVVIYEDKIQ